MALFAGSLINHDPVRFLNILNVDGPEQRTVRALAEAAGVSLDYFRCILPVYYGYFLWIKRANRYGDAIQRRAEKMIAGAIYGRAVRSVGGTSVVRP